jgi:succinoglycan biosynthesis protein ExoA
MPTRVSVVMPVYQEAAFVEAALADLLGQDLRLGDGGVAELEVLVVDGGSRDGTISKVAAIAARDPRVRLLHNRDRRTSAGRARGVEAARGDWIAIVDGHCRLPSCRLLRDMIELFEKTGADCLARPQPLVARDPTYWTEAICAARATRFGHNLRSTLYDDRERRVDPRSSAAMYRREVFERVGNFDPTLDAGEDVELNTRVRAAGLSCWTSPKLAVHYEPRRSLGALWRQMFGYGVGWAAVRRRHAGAGTLGPVLAAGFVAGLPALCVAPLLPAGIALAVAGPYALYAALALVSSLTCAARRPHVLTRMPAVFFVLHVGLGAGYLWGGARPERA